MTAGVQIGLHEHVGVESALGADLKDFRFRLIDLLLVVRLLDMREHAASRDSCP